MSTSAGFVLPIERLLDRAAWPKDFFGPPGFYGIDGNGDDDVFDDWLDDLFGRAHVAEYRALDATMAPPWSPADPEPPAAAAAYGFHADVWVRGPVVFGLNSFYGFEFELGGRTDVDWVRIPVTVRVGEGFEVLLHRVELRVRLPRDIFRLPMERADAFADDPFRVEVPITGSIQIDGGFDVRFLQEAPVSFGPLEVLESGFHLTVENAVFDLSREQQLPEIAQAGLPDDFRGFFSQKVTVALPTYLDSRPETAAVPGEEPRTIEFFMENVGIGTGGLHGTIGVRQTLARALPIEERPTVTANAGTTLLFGEPGNLNALRGDFHAGEVAHVRGKTADGGWFLVQPSRYDEADETIGGPAWVDATRVQAFGNFDLVPVLPSRTSDTFAAGGVLSVKVGTVSLRLEQFFIKFADSVPVDFGIRASMLLKNFLFFEGDEALQVTLTVDSKLAFALRLATTVPPDPAPDPSRADTFRVAGDAIILRVDALELAVKRLERLGVEDPEWSWQVLLDLTVFFRWSFTKRDVASGEQKAIALKGLGVKDGSPAFPTAAKLTLASESGDDAFKHGLEIKGLAFSLDSVGAGVDSGGAAYISLAGSVAHFTGFKAKGTLGVRFRWRGDEYLGVAFDKIGLKVDSGALSGELEVEWIDEAVPTPTGFEQREGWRGKGRFAMKTPPRIYVYVEAAFGDEPVNHVYVLLDVGSTSSGIPAGPIAFYGITGLAGFNFSLDKLPEQRWYEDWFRDKAPKMNAVSVTKWKPQKDAEVLGLGTVIGTSGDKGYAASAKVVFVYARPGPVVIFAGHGNILTALGELEHPERAMLAVLVVYDGAADTLSIAAQMKYETPQDGTLAAQRFGVGSLYSTSGLVDAFFDLSRKGNWHVYLGQRPPEKRIRAEFVKHFRVDGYLVIEPTIIELGVSVGWDWRKKWGPLRAELAIWVEGVVGYIYEPDQVFGALRLGGRARLSAFGFGLGVTLGADVTVGGPTPRFYHFVLVFKVEMPWFLPDINVKAEFGDRDDHVPPSPLALRGVSVTHDQPVADFPATLHPDLDPDGDGLVLEAVGATYDEAAAVAGAPLVPLDAKPAVAFGHPFNDRTGVVENPTGVLYKEAFGDEGFFRYDLAKVELWKRLRGSSASTAWTLLDERSDTTTQPPVDWSDYDGDLHVFGHTRLRAKLLTDGSGGELVPVGLRFWAKTPFNMHLVGDEEVEGTVDTDAGYPCVSIPPKPAPECADYAASLPGTPLGPSSVLGRVAVHSPIGGRVVLAGDDVRAGRFGVAMPGSRLRFTLPERARWVRVSFLGRPVLHWWAGREGAVTFAREGDANTDVFHADDAGIDWIEALDPAVQVPGLSLAAPRSAYLVREVCFEPWSGMADLDLALDALGQFGSAFPAGVDVQAETMLEPDQEYRLALTTEVLYSEDGSEWQARDTFTQTTYFKTAGPPGLFPSSSLLKDLGAYVHHSSPAAGATPVYRSYDVRVAFRDDAAVRGMYARSLETLRLEVSDGSEGVADSADGRPSLVEGTWARDVRIDVASQVGRWRRLLELSPCVDPAPHGGGDVLVATPVGLLRPERGYRASLVLASSPTLRRERFTAADLATMTPVDGPVVGGFGAWAVETGRLVQRSPVRGPVVAGVSTRPGPMLLVGEQSWRNYRVSASFDAPVGTVGLVCGFVDEANHYLVGFDTAAGTVELVRVLAGTRTRLALQTPPSVAASGVVDLAVTFTGEWLEVSVGDERLEPVLESSLPRGRCGVFTSGAAGAAFVSLTVAGVSLFEFAFTTSRYANFVDHVGSFGGVAATLPSPVALADVRADVATLLATLPAASDATDAAERQRGEVFDSLLAALGLPAGEPDSDVDVTLVQGADGPACWLVESPEPLWWRDRTTLSIARQEVTWGGEGGGGGGGGGVLDPDTVRLHPRAMRLGRFPGGEVGHNLGALKLVAVNVDDEGGSSLEFLVAADRDLQGVRIQLREGRDSYVDWFEFRRSFPVRRGERIRIHDGITAAELPPPRSGRHELRAPVEALRPLAEAGTVIRILAPNGTVQEVIPLHPVLEWVTIDPARLRLAHTPDTRNAIVFVADSSGLPAPLPPGAYRMTLTLQRDLGTPESTWTAASDSSPEVATITVTVPDPST